MFQNDARPVPKGKRRPAFSDRLERRRGHRDGETGRAPASMAAAYMAGYAEGRRRRSGRRPPVSATSDSGDGIPQSGIASPASGWLR